MVVAFLILLAVAVILRNAHINRGIAGLVFKYGKMVDYRESMDSAHIYQDPIYIFMHICTKGPYWRKIVESQLRAIVASGLYDRCTQIYYGCSCDSCEKLLREFFMGWAKVSPLEGAQGGKFENMTLNKMIEKCRVLGRANCLYLHSKGSTGRSPSQHAWREYMMHWLVEKHKMSLDLLNRGYLTTGVLYQTIPFGIWGYDKLYSGNFFWVRSEYMRELPLILDMDDRYEAEKLIFKKYMKGRHVNLTNDFYFSGYIPWKMGLYQKEIHVRPHNGRILVV